MQILPFFARLGDAIEDAWRDAGRDPDAFPLLACRLLTERAPAAGVPVTDILDWFFGDAPVVEQSQRASFGQPPVTLYQGRGFYIEALFWMTATTAIHQHAFRGAFTPLAGSSVCSTFRYTTTRLLDPAFSVGVLEREESEILRPGMVRPITAGPGLIHQLFHLDRPSITIVVRTHTDPASLPQLAYLPPGLAMDGGTDDPVTSRQLTLLGVMLDSGLADAETYAARILAAPAVVPAYRVLSYLVARGVPAAVQGGLLDVARRAHGEVADLFYQAAQSQRRIALITQLRETTGDADLRFFLALLMLLPDRDAIFRLVAADRPGCDPAEVVMAWAQRLAASDRVGVELDELNTTIFRGLLGGLDPSAILDFLAEEYESSDIARSRAVLLDHAARLARSEIFLPLFVAGASS